ncbi:GrlR family regulatory protein [Janthinobacterium sp. B9-8]|uniref:GrlR family regulatory protein n=1 Tax=Janthinobacterium sp. B9-8 TaxID=1236179 RepID=UPI00061D3A0C|nr:GrlR family regulatory protein [Janthinobacterium sp. B9-8]AMC35344.1 hypothetical protein VN23_12350 [Janthinobacterium sp. B9-8]
MKDGIYHVRFSSSMGSAGEGLVVIKEGMVNGGDAGYLYIGQLSHTAEALTGNLKIKRWKHGHTSVFGPLDSFDLKLSGPKSEGNSFSVSGGMIDHPGVSIKIAGDFLANAA